MLAQTQATGTAATEFPVPNGTKKLIQPQSQSVNSSKSQKSRKSRKSRKSNIQDVQDDEIIDLYAVIPTEGTVLTYMKITLAPSL